MGSPFLWFDEVTFSQVCSELVLENTSMSGAAGHASLADLDAQFYLERFIDAMTPALTPVFTPSVGDLGEFFA